MTDGSASGSPAESAVCDEGNCLVQLHSCQSTCRIEHFSHSRTSLRSFVSDNYYIAVYDLACIDSSDSIFFTVEDSCRTAVCQHFRSDRTSLNYAAFLSDVAPHNCDATCLTVRIVDRTDSIVISNMSIADVFTDSFTCSSDQAFINEAFLIQFAEYSHQTACSVQVVHVSAACRCQMTEIRNSGTELVEDLHVQFNACFVGDSQQMEHAV